jgi:hypothetical protein
MKYPSWNNGLQGRRAWLLPLLLLVLAPLSVQAQEREPPRFTRALTFLGLHLLTPKNLR